MATDWGRVQVFRPFPSCPDIVFGRTAARSDAFGPMEASGGAPVVVGSAAGSDEADVAVRARNELVERVSNILAGRAAEREGKVVASFDQLRQRGTAALDPAAWRPPADGIRRVPMLWVAGRSLLDGREVLVPGGAAFLRHRPPAGSPATLLRAGSAGVAANSTEPRAVRHALREVLERDLVARSWRGAGCAPVTCQPPWPWPLDTALEALGLQATTLVLPGPPTTACLVACLHTPQRGEQSFGARCIAGGDVAEGFERAVYEALMVRWSMSTPVARRAWEEMRGREGPPLPSNALEHALWTFHEQDSLGHWLAMSVASQCDRRSPETELASALAEHTGDDVVVLDSTAPAAGADTVVVRVVAPGAERLPVTAVSGALPHPFG
jgi:ribosomal protein S12 methylthiotransferase accessory factor